jgi:fructose-bisphosphate aldolase, class II
MVKVNIGTILNVAWTSAVRSVLEVPEVVDPRKYLRPARDAVADVVARLSTVIGGPA